MPAAAPSLDDIPSEILSEILLRLPPQPSSLPRASAVSKRWHSIACDPGFCSSFRRRHRRNPPLLGFFNPNEDFNFVPTLDAPNRVLFERFSWSRTLSGDYDPDCYVPCGSRHGLVLIVSDDKEDHHIMVWDPVTGDQVCIDTPPGFEPGTITLTRGTVLRDAGDVNFRVVLAGADEVHYIVRVYSSETSVWSDPVSVLFPPEPLALELSFNPAVLVGDSLYWQLRGSFNGVFEFNLERQSLVLIPLLLVQNFECLSVIRDEGGGLGFLSVSGFTAQLWKRETNGDTASWVIGRTIELDKLLSLDPDKHEKIEIAGYAEENNLVFLNTAIDLFTVQLQSLQFTLLGNAETTWYFPFIPFESVYTAETCSNGPDDSDRSDDSYLSDDSDLSEQDIGSPG